MVTHTMAAYWYASRTHQRNTSNEHEPTTFDGDVSGIILIKNFSCFRCVISLHDGSAPRASTVGQRQRRLVSFSLPSLGSPSALVWLIPLSLVHEPYTWGEVVPPFAAARYAGHLGQPKHR